MRTKDELLMNRKMLMDVVDCIDEFISLLDREESGETISEEEEQRIVGKFMLYLMKFREQSNG